MEYLVFLIPIGMIALGVLSAIEERRQIRGYSKMAKAMRRMRDEAREQGREPIELRPFRDVFKDKP